MSGEVITLTDFRKTADEQNTPVAEVGGFSPETQSDTLANDLMHEMYKGLKEAGICPMVDSNEELLTAMYDLTRAITDRHFDVFNELVATRNIQAEHGSPFYVIGVGTNDYDEETD